MVFLHGLSRALVSSEVIVEPAAIRLVSSLERLRNFCGDEPVEACTRFVGYRLDAACVAGDGGWRIDATATFRPWVVLHTIARLSHERDHIEDVRRSASQYVAALRSVQYESSQQCGAHALEAGRDFSATMREFALNSAFVRHEIRAEVARSGP